MVVHKIVFMIDLVATCTTLNSLQTIRVYGLYDLSFWLSVHLIRGTYRRLPSVGCTCPKDALKD